jgi:glycosyltransferase involved in cell wall biosynthesis
MDKKIKILTLGDHPLSASGIGTQTKYIIENMLKTGKYRFFCLGGAMKHNNYDVVKTKEWEDDWIIQPIDGYGNQEIMRSILRHEKPDIVWFMTDPRFWHWLWHMEHEVRPLAPMIYYHVWDNFPPPTFNQNFYRSNDFIATISKVTNELVKIVAPEVDSDYIPHVVDENIFKKCSQEEVNELKTAGLVKETNFINKNGEEKFIFFWNNRNARRKQSGSLIFWFKDFLDRVGHDKASLIMHTDVKDAHGQDLEAIIRRLGLTNGEVMFSTNKYPPHTLAQLYTLADCTINIADAEGFGLATFESLACETPIIVTMTGGLQEQVTNGEEWFGIGIEPSSKAIIGSQEIPWIYEDRLNGEEVISAMEKMYNMPKEEREELGRKGRQHVITNYNREEIMEKWDDLFTRIYEENGSWENRKNYKSWHMKEVL